MAQTIVLVTFYSRGGSTETLATAAAVGAVQARAGIRMRRIADADPAAVLARYPQHEEPLRRMHKEYVAPRDADPLAADVLVFATTPDLEARAPEWAAYLGSLAALEAVGQLRGKIAAIVDTGPASASFASIVERLGLTLVTAPDEGGDPIARATALGRAAVAAARARGHHPNS